MAADLSLQEAAQLYDLSPKTLGRRLRNGEIEAYRSEGPQRGEWRVSAKALEAFGYRRRPASEPVPKEEASDARRLNRLEREVLAARRAAVAERRQSDDLSRRLDQALTEVARLRAALAAETSRRVHAELAAQGEPPRDG